MLASRTEIPGSAPAWYGKGTRNINSMRPFSVAIFLVTYCYIAEGRVLPTLGSATVEMIFSCVIL